ncbi:MAG: hypothetical protein A2Y38_15120 [Spirochaetes bacterium GWB1_59_5]|nr:MAG: hypothetical protein A2Y38_15120 [Spirochaetes bacterium GWB1_59_5]
MTRFIVSFSIIFLGLAAGFLFIRLVKNAIIPLGSDATERLRLALQRFALLVINPVIFCGAIWSLDLSDARYFLLPIVGISALALGLALGFAGSKALKLPPDQAGVHITSASFTNIGSIGGLVVFMLLGESAFALVPLYKVFEELFYYSVLFPVARSHSEKSNTSLASAEGRGPLFGILKVLRDPFFLVSVASIAAGLGLNQSGLTRPAFYSPLNAALVPTGTFLLLFGVGMRLRFRIARKHMRGALLVLVGKMLVVPAGALLLAWSLGLERIPDGMGLKVVLILSMMPTAFLSLVSAAMFHLDEDYANSLWLASNGAIVLIVPLLATVLPLLG